MEPTDEVLIPETLYHSTGKPFFRTNALCQIENSFATGRHRTVKTRGCVSRESMLSMVFKLAISAQQRWKRLSGSERLGEIFSGIASGMGAGRRKNVLPEQGMDNVVEKNTGNVKESFLQLKITLKGIRPPIWRRFLVPEGISLSDFHDVIQEVIGMWPWNTSVIRMSCR